jgi:tetratricopeptide (TPR) repeat protein
MNLNIPVVSIMIKNEEEKICKTLEPFVNDYKNFVIYDTGSTDSTIEVVSKYLNDNNINFILVQEEFINFAESRNRLIDIVKENFSEYKFFLMLDCEWYICNPKKLIEYCQLIKNEKNNYYTIDIHMNNFIFCQSRLFRINSDCKFLGPVHEYVESKTFNFRGAIKNDVYFKYTPTTIGIEKSRLRYSRDLKLILDHLEKNRDSRYVFYLAQTYACLEMYDEAIIHYNERFNIKYYDEERFISMLRLGKIYEKLNKWEFAFEAYMRGYSIRPSRIETLVYISKHYNDNTNMKYTFSKMACSVDYPKDVLFVENELYHFTRWEQLGISSWYLGNYEEGLNATLKALDYKPNTYLINNCLLYKKKMSKESYNSCISRFNKKVINLILYSENDPMYIEIKELLSKFLKSKGIKHYFYIFKPDITDDYFLDDNILYIKGEESYIPGILDKTIKALEFIKDNDYDYVVRSNISTIINFEILKYYLNDFDFGGPLIYTACHENHISGMIGKNFELYKDLGFISGTCIILSKKGVNFIIDNRKKLMEYTVVDDVAIGALINTSYEVRNNILKIKRCGTNNLLFVNSENYNNSQYIAYRNKSKDRNSDFKIMKLIIEMLENFSV